MNGFETGDAPKLTLNEKLKLQKQLDTEVKFKQILRDSGIYEVSISYDMNLKRFTVVKVMEDRDIPRKFLEICGIERVRARVKEYEEDSNIWFFSIYVE